MADRFSPSPTMQLTSRKRHLLLQYVHTHVFLSNNIKEEQGKNDSHPEREKKKKKQVKKKRNTNICALLLPSTNGKRTDTEYKNITIFIYQIASVGSCSGIRSFLKRACQPRESLFLTFWFFFFDYHLQFQLSNALCITANMTCPVRFSVFFSGFVLMNLLFFFTLQNYTSIHIFSSLNSCF